MIPDPGQENESQPDLPVLNLLAPLPPSSRKAMTIRRIMVVVAVLAIALAAVCLFNPLVGLEEWLGGGTLGTPFAPVYKVDSYGSTSGTTNLENRYFVEACGYLAIFLLTQWWFLSPRGSWKIGLSLDGPPPKRAAIAAGFIGMLLSIGLLATLMEIPNLWLALTAEGEIKTDQHFGTMWIVMGAVWIFWAMVFNSYWKSMDRYTGLRRVFRKLLAGTILEMVIAAPAHAYIMESRGGDCYCERGTWTGVAFGCTAVLWLFGPGAFLLFLREKRRRERLI